MIQSALPVGGARRGDRPAAQPHHPVRQGVGGAGSDRGLCRPRAALRLRAPSRSDRSRHGLQGHRRFVRRHGHPAAAGHRRHHPHLAHAGARRRPHPRGQGRRRNCCRPWASAPSCRWWRPARAAGARPPTPSRSWRATSRAFIRTSMPEWKKQLPRGRGPQRRGDGLHRQRSGREQARRHRHFAARHRRAAGRAGLRRRQEGRRRCAVPLSRPISRRW